MKTRKRMSPFPLALTRIAALAAIVSLTLALVGLQISLADSGTWDRNPTDAEIQGTWDAAVQEFRSRQMATGAKFNFADLEVFKFHRTNASKAYDSATQVLSDVDANAVLIKFSFSQTNQEGKTFPPTFGFGELIFDRNKGAWVFGLISTTEPTAAARDQRFEQRVRDLTIEPGWSPKAGFFQPSLRSSEPGASTEPSSKPPQAACSAAIQTPGGLRPGDTLAPSATISSVDGKPVQGIIQQVWYINGVQTDSVKWDGREARILLQLSCQGSAAEFRATVPAYTEAPVPTKVAGTATAVGSTGTGIGAIASLPVPGIGGVGKIPGPGSFDRTLVGVLVPGLIGLVGTLVGGLLGGAGSAPAGAGPVGGASPAGDRAGKQPLTRDEIAQRHAKTLNDIAQATKDAAAANSFWGLFKGTSSSAGQEMKELGTSVVQGVSSTVKGIANAAKDVWQDKSLVKDTLVGSLKTVKEGFAAVTEKAASAAGALQKGLSQAWNDPKSLLDKLQSGGKIIYNAVTNPKNLVELAKTVSGYKNFANSMDPNRSLGERIVQVGLGVGNLFTTLTAAGSLTKGLTTGVTTLISKETKVAVTAAAERQGARSAAARAIERAAGAPAAEKAIAERAAARTATAAGAERTAAKSAVTTAAERNAGNAVNSDQLLARGAKGIVEAPPGVAPDIRGIPKSQVETLQEIARKRGVEIGVRPPAKEAGALLESGKALPKPPTIHNKSLNEIDNLIGGPANREGMVGHFKPELPPDKTLANMSPDLRKKVVDRFEERSAEFGKYADEIAKGQQSQKIKVIDGVIHDAKTGKPLVSDVDLAGIFRNGKPVPEDVGKMIVAEIMKKCPGVTHPDINSWYAVFKDQKAIMSGVMAKHAQGGQALATISSNGIRATFLH